MIFDIDGNILESYNEELGYLIDRYIPVNCFWIIDKEEVGHYETVREFPNGGKTVEWRVDEQEEGHWDIQVENNYEHDYQIPDYAPKRTNFVDEWHYQEFVPYTDEELQEIQKRKELTEQRQQELQQKQEFNDNLPKTISDLDEAICTLYELTLGE